MSCRHLKPDTFKKSSSSPYPQPLKSWKTFLFLLRATPILPVIQVYHLESFFLIPHPLPNFVDIASITSPASLSSLHLDSQHLCSGLHHLCKTPLIGFPASSLCPLQSIFHMVAKVILLKHKSDYLTPLLNEIQWLLIYYL